MISYRSLDSATERLFEETLQKVDGQLEIRRKDHELGLKLLAKFDGLKIYKSLFVHHVTELKGRSGAFIILLVEKHVTIIEQKKNTRVEKDIEEVEPVLLFSLPHDMGRAYIREETVADKIADMFTKIDIDFNEYPDFSRNYFVTGDSPDKIRKYLPRQLMESLEKIRDISIEINGNWGLLRTKKNVSENLLLLLISIGYKMTK
ncbi:MAG: hypothetical protein ACK5RG_20260 [Cyclobacteriaceae bacterium]|jgi:hypothetical protein|nr:hypothetical protein [Flammeovirgaceae bacterium]